MAETFGSPDWCIWCKSKEMSEARSYGFVEKEGGAPETVHVCSEACEREVDRTAAMVRQGRKPFFVSLAVVFVLGVAGAVLAVALTPALSAVCGLGLVIFGGIIFRFPLVTPQTILLFGFRKGLAVGRVAGIVLLLMGLAIAVGAFFLPPASG